MIIDTFTQAYIEAALWSSTDNADDQGGEPLDKNYSIDDIASDTLVTMVTDCAQFQRDNAADITEDNVLTDRGDYSADELAGHDFWLNRNGHGCGFWDGDWAEPAASRLDASSKAFGGVDLYVGDDGLIHC
jgi:hypothetical protein